MHARAKRKCIYRLAQSVGGGGRRNKYGSQERNSKSTKEKLPKMVKGTASDEDSEEELEFSCLTDAVRQQYFHYLVKQLEENVRAWCHNKGQCLKLITHVKDCAEMLEEKAIKLSMVTQLYQRAMIKIIADVKRLTSDNCLEERLLQLHSLEGTTASKRRKHPLTLVTQGTQTEEGTSSIQTGADDYDEDRKFDITMRPLDERIELFEKTHLNLNEHQQSKRKCEETLTTTTESSINTNNNASPSMPTPTLLSNETTAMPGSAVENFDCEDDEVAKELALLFRDEPTEFDDIFGITDDCAVTDDDDPQISSILKEIASAPTPCVLEAPIAQNFTDIKTEPSRNCHVLDGDDAVEIKSEPILCQVKGEPPPHCHAYDDDDQATLIRGTTPSPQIKDENPQNATVRDLRQSLWPCELYRQRRLLTECLNRHDDLRWAEKIRIKFHALFGEDSDDEFAIYSPTTELNEVLMASCIRRISPWLVRYLMTPLQCNLIANRYLFKKLAKHLARTIILHNQYPSELDVKHAVENYFCLYQAVRTLDDIH